MKNATWFPYARSVLLDVTSEELEHYLDWCKTYNKEPEHYYHNTEHIYAQARLSVAPRLVEKEG
jgi:hypothetical protein